LGALGGIFAAVDHGDDLTCPHLVADVDEDARQEAAHRDGGDGDLLRGLQLDGIAEGHVDVLNGRWAALDADARLLGGFLAAASGGEHEEYREAQESLPEAWYAYGFHQSVAEKADRTLASSIQQANRENCPVWVTRLAAGALGSRAIGAFERQSRSF
jgi:hypothetical protein